MASKCCCKLALLLLCGNCVLIAVRGDRVPSNEGREQVLYAEEWAVEIDGGEAVAQQLAEKYGIANRGQVS